MRLAVPRLGSRNEIGHAAKTVDPGDFHIPVVIQPLIVTESCALNRSLWLKVQKSWEMGEATGLLPGWEVNQVIGDHRKKAPSPMGKGALNGMR